MNLFELTPHIITSENAIQFLCDREILGSEPTICSEPLCVRKMTEVRTGKRRRSGGDDIIWRCPSHKLAQIAHFYPVNNWNQCRRDFKFDFIHNLLRIRCFSHIYFSFLHISKSWHFRGESWHILLQMPQIWKLMSDSCSATPKTPRNAFLRSVQRPRKPLEMHF